MSKAKKGTIQQQEIRRLNEVLKAQGNVRGYTPDISSSTISPQKVSKKEDSFVLPISDIKKDLIKTTLFALFSIVVIVALSKTGFGLDHFSKVVKF